MAHTESAPHLAQPRAVADDFFLQHSHLSYAIPHTSSLASSPTATPDVHATTRGDSRTLLVQGLPPHMDSQTHPRDSGSTGPEWTHSRLMDSRGTDPRSSAREHSESAQNEPSPTISDLPPETEDIPTNAGSSETHDVPSPSGHIGLETIFANTERLPGQLLVDAIHQRKLLFFDETVDVLLILRTPWADEATLKSFFSRLSLVLEARIARPSKSSGLAAHDLIVSQTLTDTEDPFILLDEAESDSDTDPDRGFVYAVWNMPVPLSRPRNHINDPQIVFTVSAGLKPQSTETGSSSSSSLLRQSGVPAGMNLLSSFLHDPYLIHTQNHTHHNLPPEESSTADESSASPPPPPSDDVHLSALRIQKVAPRANPRDRLRSIPSQAHLTLPILPAFHARLRFHRCADSGHAYHSVFPPVLAFLDLDLPPYLPCPLQLQRITLSIADAGVEDMNAHHTALALPRYCQAHERLTLVYRVSPRHVDDVMLSSTRELRVSIEARAYLDAARTTTKTSSLGDPAGDHHDHPNRPSRDGSSDGHKRPDREDHEEPACAPLLRLDWSQYIDFTPSVNPPLHPRAHHAAGATVQHSLPTMGLFLTLTAMPTAHGASPSTPPSNTSSQQNATSTLTPTTTSKNLTRSTQTLAESTNSTTTSSTDSTSTPHPTTSPSSSSPPSLEALQPGSIFSWTVHVTHAHPPASASAYAHTPRRMALIPILRRRKNEIRPTRPVSSHAHAHAHAHGHGPPDLHPQNALHSLVSPTQGRQRPFISGQHQGPQGPQPPPGIPPVADAVLEEALLHRLQQASVVESPDMICLTPDVRLGPLAPGACQTTELRFRALRTGRLELEALRVVDLASQEHVDVRTLPAVVV